MIHRLLDALISGYAGGTRAQGAAAARAEFLEETGKVFDDDGELFEARIQAFLEWYVLERPFEGGAPPVVRALSEMRGLQEEERGLLAYLSSSHRSLFLICGTDARVIDLEDLIGGGRFAVVERRSTVGFEVGDVFEGRLIFDGQSLIFGRSFLFHPRDARKDIVALVNGAVERGECREDILARLSRLHVRWHRHSHNPLQAARAYRSE